MDIDSLFTLFRYINPTNIVISIVLLILSVVLTRYFVPKKDYEKQKTEQEKHRTECFEKIKKTNERVGKIEDIIIKHEYQLENMPTKDDISDIKESLAIMNGNSKASSEKLDSIKDNIKNINTQVQMLTENELRGK